jgi:hypothetical protein
MRASAADSVEERKILSLLRDLANRASALAKDARRYRFQINDLVQKLHPALLDEPGVGPICAASLLAFNPQRFHSEGAFARSNGTAPLPASSGKKVRHRLSRGGDRQVNSAIHRIAVCRAQYHPQTRDYLARRISEGKTKREALRSLKRH